MTVLQSVKNIILYTNGLAFWNIAQNKKLTKLKLRRMSETHELKV